MAILSYRLFSFLYLVMDLYSRLKVLSSDITTLFLLTVLFVVFPLRLIFIIFVPFQYPTDIIY